MSKLQELINRLCPNGVEFLALGSICEIKTGKGITKKDAEKGGNFPIISGGQTPMGFFHISNRKANTVTISRVGAYAGFVSYIKEDFYLNDKCFSIIPNTRQIFVPFLFYFLKHIEEKIRGLQSEGGVPTINTQKVGALMIPVPPIEVQEEIVKILDRFSDYAAELQAELQARREQYEYYRNLLLTFNPSACGCGTDDKQEGNVTTWGGHSYKINWKTMEEVFEFRNGYTPSKNIPKYWEGGTIPWFRMEDIRDFGRILSDSYQHITADAIKGKGLFEKNSFILATTATIGEHALIIADSLANQQFTNLNVRKSLSDKLVTKFIYYYLFIVDEFCKNNTNVSGFASVDMGKLKKMPFPIPPLELQEKIVAILDRFETLVNDLSQGLPAEIAAVREQYEYYRNQLLTFKQLA